MSGKNPKEFVHKKEIRKIRTRGASVKYKCCPNETEYSKLKLKDQSL